MSLIGRLPGFGKKLYGGRYRVLGEIGSGGMGVVYRARDEKANRVVALKVLHPHLRRDPAYVKRFEQEAQIARALDSRHVVRVLDSGEEAGAPYIVMEYVEGQTLAERLKHGPLAIDAVLDVAIQVARALEEAHDKNVLHRDVKPENVIIQPDGDVKVADFGIARVEEAGGGGITGDFLGAIHYMAPERFSRQADARSDLYSLGVLLYEMLTGRPPFSAPDSYSTIRQVLEDEPEHVLAVRPDTDARLAVLVHECLAKEPEERPASALDARRYLEDLWAALTLARPQGRPRLRPAAAAVADSRPLAMRVGLAMLVLLPLLGIIFVALLRGDDAPSTVEASAARDASLRSGPGPNSTRSRQSLKARRYASSAATAMRPGCASASKAGARGGCRSLRSRRARTSAASLSSTPACRRARRQSTPPARFRARSRLALSWGAAREGNYSSAPTASADTSVASARRLDV